MIIVPVQRDVIVRVSVKPKTLNLLKSFTGKSNSCVSLVELPYFLASNVPVIVMYIPCRNFKLKTKRNNWHTSFVQNVFSSLLMIKIYKTVILHVPVILDMCET